MLAGSRILVGITGGIAAYKSVLLIRALQQGGADVRAVATPSATRFIGLETLRAITRQDVPVHVFEEGTLSDPDAWTRHIHWGEWADLLVVAPCTANTLAKLAHGFADNMLTSTALARRCPMLVCPTMDGGMYAHPATQRNLELLRGQGAHILPPDTGYLASGMIGEGRLPDTSRIIQECERLLDGDGGRAANSDEARTSDPTKETGDPPKETGQGSTDTGDDARGVRPHPDRPFGALHGKRVLVTAGPTREPIDAVRFLSNPSTGKMGIAMAMAARLMGADVDLLLGPTGHPAPAPLRATPFTTAADLFKLVKERHARADVIIMCAAVADVRPINPSDRKMKKHEIAGQIELERTDDILMWITGHRTPGQTIIGFAMETDSALEHARAKLIGKSADAILVNELRPGESGFAADVNDLTLLRQDRMDVRFQGDKNRIAHEILMELFAR